MQNHRVFKSTETILPSYIQQNNVELKPRVPDHSDFLLQLEYHFFHKKTAFNEDKVCQVI